MFGKIFEQIYDSSIAEDWTVRVVFQDMIILADENGVVDRTPEAISRRTNVPIDIVTRAIDELQKPDPTSRSPEEKGARIKLLDDHRKWGWEIINFAYYRNLCSAYQKRERTKLRTRKWRENNKKQVEASHRVTMRQRAASASASVQGNRGVGEEGGNGQLKPTWEMCQDWLKKARANGANYSEAETRGAYLALSAGGWMWGRRPIADFRSAIERQIQTDRERRPTTGLSKQAPLESLEVRRAKAALRETDRMMKNLPPL